MSEAVEFTPTQVAILQVLSDGAMHRREELARCVPDELASNGAFNVTITRLRNRLKKRGENIRCVVENNIAMYQHVRLVSTNTAE